MADKPPGERIVLPDWAADVFARLFIARIEHEQRERQAAVTQVPVEPVKAKRRGKRKVKSEASTQS